MNYLELYDQTILKLKNNERPLIKLNPELIKELKIHWGNILSAPVIDQSSLAKILCILDNTQNYSSEFNDLFFDSMKNIGDDEMIIYLLAASQKHVINEALRSGVMIPPIYFEELKKLLKNKNPEVLEWTLRTIESMGPLSMRFKSEIRNAKPGFIKLFNSHQKSSAQIIELLELQWKKMI
jgi:hypothetical protein